MRRPRNRPGAAAPEFDSEFLTRCSCGDIRSSSTTSIVKTPAFQGKGVHVSERRMLSLAVLLPAAVVAAVACATSGARIARHDPFTSAVKGEGEEEEGTSAMRAKLAAYARFAAPDSKEEGDKLSWAEQEWLAHSIPGIDIPSASIEVSRADWGKVHGRGAASGGRWTSLGPTWAKSLPNPYRDRAVYNAGTPDFSGRIAHVAIDP